MLQKRQRSRRKRTPRRASLRPFGIRRIFVGHCCLVHPPLPKRQDQGQAVLRQCKVAEDKLQGWRLAHLRQDAGALMRRRFTRMLSRTEAKKKLRVTPGLSDF